MIVISLFGLETIELSPVAKIVIPFFGVLLITMSMMMGIRKKRRRSHMQGTAREQVEELKHKKAMRGDLEQLMVEIEQLAKRFGAQLDAKTVQMEQLLDEADRRIADLKRLGQEREQRSASAEPGSSSLTPPTSASTNPQPQTPSPQPPSPDDAVKRSVYDLADQGHDPVQIAQKLDEHVGKVELILALRKT